MRPSFQPIVFAAAALALAAAFPAHSQGKDKAARAASARAAVPAEVRARVVAKLPGAKAEDVAPSPVPGLYEVTMGGPKVRRALQARMVQEHRRAALAAAA